MVIWRDIVRSVFYDRTRLRPIPFSDQWEPDHPVLVAFVENSLGDTTFQLHESFKERIDSYDSASTPVVRIADVVAAIVRRSEDSGPLLAARRLLKPSHCDSYPCTVLARTGERLTPGRTSGRRECEQSAERHVIDWARSAEPAPVSRAPQMT